MAPMAVSDSHHLKRTSSIAQFDGPAAKKLNRGPLRHHKPSWNPQRELRLNATIFDDESIRSLLTRSIGLALEAVGFEAAAPEAVESFRSDVEEYMAHYLADVRQSMLSCRRTEPIPQDFLQSLHTHQLSLRSLIPHLDPPVQPKRSQIPLNPDSAQEDEHQQLQLLGTILNEGPDEQAKIYVPKHFPELPSKHTYKVTAELPDRVMEPRKVRERATEEGRLGEEALRRFVSAGSGHQSHMPQHNQGPRTQRARRDQMFMETMAAVSGEVSDRMDIDGGLGNLSVEKPQDENQRDLAFGSGRLHSAVNSEKRYWRKPVPHRLEGGGNEGGT